MPNRIKTILLLVIVIITTFPLIGQNSIDSLKTSLATSNIDTVKIIVLNKLSKELRLSDPVLAMDYAIKAEKSSNTNNYKSGIALAYHNIGAIYSEKRNNELALEYYNKSLKLEQELNNKIDIANLYGNIGLIYERQRKFEKAINFYNKSLKLKQELNDTIGIAYSYEYIGIIYTEQGKYDKALIHFYKSLRIKESLNDKYGMAESYGNIGIIYLKIGSFDQAKVSLQRSLRLSEEINNKFGIAISSLHLGDIYYQQARYKKALDAFNRSLLIYIAQENIKGIADSYIKLGNVYYAQGKVNLAKDEFVKSLEYNKKINNSEGIISARISLAIYYKKISSYELAEMQLRESIRLANMGAFLEAESMALDILADILIIQEQFNEAALLLVKSRDITDTIFNERLISEVTKIQMQHDFDNRLKEKAYLEKSQHFVQELHLKRVTYMRNISIIGFILILIIACILVMYARLVRKKNKLLEKQKMRIANQVVMLDDQKQKLIKVNNTKDKFMSIIGHDLRNPFNAINSFVSLVTEQLVDFDKEVFKKYLLLIKEAGNNAQSLLENLLEWAMNQSGELKTQPEKLALNSLLKGNLLLIKELAKQKNIKITEELKGDPLVVADKNMINTVLRNLLSNAIKFTPENGQVTLKSIVGNNEVKIIVEDSGIGMSEDQLNNLLENGLFTNIETGISSSGLGVVLCQDFLQQHNQKLYATSQIGNGSVFWFFLPLKN